MINGGGYPKLEYPRDCHQGSKLVHVCDVYDALRTNRPYRAAWPAPKVLGYLEERAGTEFDPDIARSFAKMMVEWEPKVAQIEEPASEAAAATAAPPAATPAEGSAPAGQG
jgi:HD-GYP domain-containing protein (c-di-GMP phosphodiesterase class II)